MKKNIMNRVLFTLVALVLAVVVALAILQFIMGLLGTILQVGIAGVLVLLIASAAVRVARNIGRSKNPDPTSQVSERGQEVQHAVIEQDW